LNLHRRTCTAARLPYLPHGAAEHTQQQGQLYEPIADGIDVVRLLPSARDVDSLFGDPDA
jgi:hypothetical protein